MLKRMLCLLLCCLLCMPAQAETVQDQALGFLQAAGIGADSVNRIGNEVIIPLQKGGTARLWLYGDFDPLDLSWRFDGVCDEDMALYLDHALYLLAGLEEKIPLADEKRAQNYAVMVSNALLYLENVGRQGLQILLDKLSAHDAGNLNGLRARLASRLLGRLDNTAVDPAEGLAWYDALTIAVQNALPLPDPSAYVEDAFLAEVTALLIDYEEVQRADYTYRDDADGDKATTFVYLSAVTTRMDGDAATVFCHMASEKVALYDGTRVEVLAGSWVPRRIDLVRADGRWAITKVHDTGDGTEYWPSILAFCEGDEALARSLISANTPELHAEHEAALRKWLAAIGYAEVK